MSRKVTLIKTTGALAASACLLLVSMSAAQKNRPTPARSASPRANPVQAGQPAQAGQAGGSTVTRTDVTQRTRRTSTTRQSAGISRNGRRSTGGPGTATLAPLVLPPGRVPSGAILYLDAAGVLSGTAPAADTTVDSTKLYRYSNTVGWPR